MMQFESTLLEGKIINRYKRFFADIELLSGEVVTAHTPNTGSMKSCWAPGWKALVSSNNDPKRKLKYTLELLYNGQSWIGVHTGRPNTIVEQAIKAGKIEELSTYNYIKREYKVGDSRIDLFLENDRQQCFVEVKNVTLKGDEGLEDFALFPDAVSDRGLKHLYELKNLVEQGHRAVMFYLVQREDVSKFSAAFEIDPAYSDALYLANEAGVEVLVYQCHLGPEGIEIAKRLEWVK